MTDITKIWPNGMGVDEDGYAVFYPLGTNKTEVPTNAADWPTGSKLIAPFVYNKDGNLTGFVDDRSLEGDTFNIPYDYVSMEICGNPIEINLTDTCDTFIVTLSKATVAPTINKKGADEVPASYEINAPELTSASGMFSNRKIKSIKLHIPKLQDASGMFDGCELTSEAIYEVLDSIPAGDGSNCINLGTLPPDVSQADILNAFAEKGWNISSMQYMDIYGNVTYSTTFSLPQQRLLEDTVKIENNECFNEGDQKIGNFDTNSVKDTTNITKLVLDLQPLVDLIDYSPEYVSEMAITVATEDEPVQDEEEIITELLEEVITYETHDGAKPRAVSLPKLTKLNSDMSSAENLAAFGSSALSSSVKPTHFNSDLSSLKRFSIDAEFKGLTEFIDKLFKLEGISDEIPEEARMYITIIAKVFGPLIESAITSYLKSNIFANTNIEEFNSNLSSLQNGNEMFGKSNILNFNADLSSLRKAKGMFGVSQEEGGKFVDYIDGIFNMLVPTIPFNLDTTGNDLTDSIGSQMSSLLLLLVMFLGGGSLLELIKQSDSGRYTDLKLCQIEKLIAVGELSSDDSSGSSSSDLSGIFGSILSGLDLGYSNGISSAALSNLVKNISDLSGKNIIHDENTGDAHIDVTVIANENETLEEIEEEVKKFGEKGWNCSAVAFTKPEGETDYVAMPLYSYEKVSRYLSDYSEEIIEIIGDLTEFRIANNNFYDKDGNLVGTIDFSKIVYFALNMLSSILGGGSSENLSPFADITSFDSDLSNVKNASMSFGGATKLTSFKGDLSNLINGLMMFTGCEKLTSFHSDLSSLEVGNLMFYGCDLDEASLKNISSTIKNVKGDGLYHIIHIGKGSNITDDIRNDFINKGWIVLNDNGQCLCNKFSLEEQKIIDNTAIISSNNCYTDLNEILANNPIGYLDTNALTKPATFFQNKKLVIFASELKSLTYGYKMFSGCTNLAIVQTNLESLTNGDNMFEFCENLEQFKGDLSSLSIGTKMFEGCVNLTHFEGDLSSLTDGEYMFTDCKLDTASIQRIAETINTVYDEPTLSLGIGNATPNEEELAAIDIIHDKGWSVVVNGSTYNPDSEAAVVTVDENGEEVKTIIPYYAKPIETNVLKAEYVGEDGKFYRIKGGQFIYDGDKEKSSYGMFTCLEDAAANMRLSKVNDKNALTSFKSAVNNKPIISKLKQIKNRVKGPISKINLNRDVDESSNF